jgi:2-polyprenyl-3-methyl-5-hydroxy-6-metoxy-1,4-benzoquinol methylase
VFTFFSDFQARSTLPEIMDHPTTSKQKFIKAMAEIRWVNCNLNGTACILTPLKKLCQNIPNEVPLKILDLGTASADIPLAIIKWAKKSNRTLRIKAMDLHPYAVDEAKRYIQGYPEIEVVQGDALHLPESEPKYDFVISSMFLHHLDNQNAIALLKSMAAQAKYGIIINDLQRHPMAWLGIRLLGWLTLKGKIFRYDSALSVKRAFKKKELENLCQKAGLLQALIQNYFPFRWVIIWINPEAHLYAK